MIKIFIISLIFLISINLSAQETLVRPTRSDSSNNDLLNSLISKQKNSSIPKIKLPDSTSKLDFIVTKAQKESLGTAIYNDYLWSLQHDKEVYEWQRFSTKIIFYAVILLVFLGMAFSGIQFYKSYKITDSADKTPDTPTELELSLKGIKVTSSILGVIILVISLAFFYLYLVHVYPINLPH